MKRKNPQPPQLRRVRQQPRRIKEDPFWEAWNRAGQVMAEIGNDAWDMV